jgi:two-component system, response regulator, stage 0 sporulation protein F
MDRILLVEDQPNQRMLYEQELVDEGYDVLTATNGADALHLFETHRPKLVIMDILLPGINGIEVMEKMLSIDPQLPIIVHSAYSSPSHDFITWFARAYVVKSCDLTELKEAVRKVMVPAPVNAEQTDPV